MDTNVDTAKTIKKDTIKSNMKTIDLNIHTLKYGIAALSIVSFITTSEGLEKVLPDAGKLTPYLISFGVQVIVLVVGTGLFNIINKVRQVNISKVIKVFSILFILIPYIAAVSFSSFFSYVFLSNNAYTNVKETDYNIKIENFFNEEAANIENLNEIAGKVILTEIQNTVPNFKTTLEQFKNNAASEITNLTNDSKLTLYSKNEIDSSVIFDSDDINNSTNVSASSLLKLQSIETALHEKINSYSTYYNTYKRLFNEVKSVTSKENLSQTITELNELKSALQSESADLDNTESPRDSYNIYIQTSVSSIKSYFAGLNTEVQALISVCENINNNKTINNRSIDLNKVYNTIYSTVNVSDNEVDNAINDLKSLISAYLDTNDTKDIDDTMLQNLSSCITYLGEFQKYKDLSGKLDIFEKTVLSQVYIIEYESDIIKMNNQAFDSTTEISSETTTQSPIKTLDKDSWNKKRREDLNNFINIIKSLPDFNTITANIQNPSNQSKEYINILKDNVDYKTDLLKEAYDINRDSLENINDIERAWNFIFSEYNYMAIYCIFVAMFLDLTPFFVGMFTYLIDIKKSKNNQNENTEEFIESVDLPLHDNSN